MKAGKKILAAFFLAAAFLALASVGMGAESAVAPLSREALDSVSREAPDAMLAARRKLGLQTELPSGKKTIESEDDRKWWQWKMPQLKISAGVAQFILYLSLAMILLALLPALRTNMWSSSRARRMQRREMEEQGAPAAVAFRMEQAQGEADDLAGQGSFAEAMHVLLLQSIAEVRLRLRVPISVSLTSREILRGIAFSPEGREAFADIVGRVEISHFGTHSPGAEDYAACRRSYDDLFAVLRQGSPL